MLNSKSNFHLLTQHNLKQNLLFDENISCVTFPQSEFFPKYFDRKKVFPYTNEQNIFIQRKRKKLFICIKEVSVCVADMRTYFFFL